MKYCLIVSIVAVSCLLSTVPVHATSTPEGATLNLGCIVALGNQVRSQFGSMSNAPDGYVDRGTTYCQMLSTFTDEVVSDPQGKVATQVAIDNGTALQIDPDQVVEWTGDNETSQ